jgi:tRNA threonylcarbamoyladenosine biosynthesis protein TsaB
MDSPEGFGQTLIGEIDSLLKRAGVGVRDIAAFASASGPGSFTGVRIGLTAVKGLGEAAGRPVIAVSNLRALASFGSDSFGAGTLRAVALDARRGEIYGAVYNAALELARDEVVIQLEAWLASLRKEVEFVMPKILTDAERNIADTLARERPASKIVQAPRAMAGAVGKIALDCLRRGVVLDPAELDANYVRRSDAELFWKDPVAAKITL